MSKKNNYIECINILRELKKSHPTYTFGQHIATATGDYKDVWGITDREFEFALKKYANELEFNLEDETSIEKIIANSVGDKLFQLEEEDEEYVE